MTDRNAVVAAVVLGILVLVSHLAGALLYPDQLWGVHLYAFLPTALLPIASVALGAALITLPLGARRVDRALAGLPDPSEWSYGRRAGAALVLFVVASAKYWFLRAGHTMLGDGNPLTKSVARGEWFHPDSLLTAMIHHVVWRAAAGLFAAHTNDALEVSRLTVALDSALAGGLFALVAWALAGEVCLAGREANASARGDHGVRVLVFLLLLTQGYVQLFSGYVENYTWLTLGIALYLWLALRTLRDPRAPLLWPGLALLLAVGCHLAGVLLLPSFVLLSAFALARRESRNDAALSVAALAVFALAGAWALARVHAGYDIAHQLMAMTRTASSGEVERTPLLSLAHLSEFLNEQALIGPLGLFVFVPAACGFVLARRGTWRIPSFLLLLGLTYFGASFVPRDLRLGYARDWDLFAPAGLVFTAVGLWLWLALTERREARSVALSLALAFSLYHTAPWIAVNHSFDRSLERLKLLPLGGGRTEAAVGYWYARAGNLEQAHRWLELGIRANPSNLPAYLVLAELDMDEGKFVEAAYAYWAASQLRPSFLSYRLNEVYALLRADRADLARETLSQVPAPGNDDPRTLGLMGMTLWRQGHRDEAGSVLDRAAAAEPRWAKVHDRLLAGDYAKTLVEDVELLLGGAP